MLFKSVIIATVLTQALSAKILEEDKSTKAITESLIETINSKKTTWKAEMSTRFHNATVADVKAMLGTVLRGEEGFMEPELEKTVFTTKDDAIPESFDVRTAWPACSAVTGRVRDQSNCGSCWAFGSTEAFNDRHCIATGDAETVFAPEDTNACCSGIACGFSMGCNGGQPAGAWKWFTRTGVSSGLDYADNGKGTSCKPYSMKSCAHHVDPPPGMVSCEDVESYSTPECTSSCYEADYGTDYKKDKHYASSSYSVKGTTNMQKELMEKGTLSVAMTVYEDFEAYSGGVYQHVTGKNLGGHAIKMIGWGVEDGTPYWLCMNSWNDSWGEEGLFKILRGSNECGIEDSVVAGDV
mmetsp:Transcript_18294/g.30672  ORF Transcript_18294/g.30672 Transcript_18294/m.30672 type:complete len:353 (-) Transcript_18294:441-1499(-)|eukprot:CAMPEP_0174962794 /NCGR_PEP_ID=MMETSP0004_2-20121128/4972_1 /TAXON_ID=420556 /ORGANISM="Ochromonas sp., Strain CCMP1393" /LENGTH=352 /DNA_ID=CAMNT_0016211347 /DNA_START=75 /DNA_END=1133 /DNA_ORIENTATION=-